MRERLLSCADGFRNWTSQIHDGADFRIAYPFGILDAR